VCLRMSTFREKLDLLASHAGMLSVHYTDDQESAWAEFVITKRGKVATRIVYFFETGDILHFICPSETKGNIENDELYDHELFYRALLSNGRNNRGFWGIPGTDDDLSLMYSIASSLVTPREFNEICWYMAEKVDEFNRLIETLNE
jgi:hypothetical protein